VDERDRAPNAAARPDGAAGVDGSTAAVPDEPYYAVGLLYHAPSRRVLLNQRAADAPSAPGQWALFGGRSEPADRGDPARTWRREVAEELGVQLTPDAVVPLASYLYTNGLWRHVFCVAWPSAELEGFVLGEGQAMAWLRFDEAAACARVTETTKRDLARLRERLGI
jgi:8-oxo-dGTP pyrophosphatase MutT (NUDIX family)